MTLGASLLGNLLTGKGVTAKIRGGEDTIRVLEILTNFEIRKYYQNEPKFNGVDSRNNLPKIKDGACVINLN